MEVYDAGVVLQYDQQHLEVRFGGLTDKPFDAAGFPVAEIARDDFESMVNSCCRESPPERERAWGQLALGLRLRNQGDPSYPKRETIDRV
jgi:hypothetical protein